MPIAVFVIVITQGDDYLALYATLDLGNYLFHAEISADSEALGL